MKLLKYTLLVMAILGISASIYNFSHTQSIYDLVKGLLLGIFIIFVSLNLNGLTNGFKNFKFPKS